MFKLTFENGEGLHAIYNVSLSALYQYLYDADLEDTEYEIVNVDILPNG